MHILYLLNIYAKKIILTLSFDSKMHQWKILMKNDYSRAWFTGQYDVWTRRVACRRMKRANTISNDRKFNELIDNTEKSYIINLIWIFFI